MAESLDAKSRTSATIEAAVDAKRPVSGIMAKARDVAAAAPGEAVDKLRPYAQAVEEFPDYPEYHRLDSAGTEPTCRIAGRELVMLCSNNYLGLANHPLVVERARAAMTVHGLGPGGSRCLCGNVHVLEELDQAVADFMGTEDAITFPTGYMANLSAFRALLDPYVGALPCKRGSGTVFVDQANHATVFDGIELSSAARVVFRHNDVDDLERRLAEPDPGGPRVVVVEGVYTLTGEVAPLAEIAAVCHRHNALLYVDDAHGIGVLGGRGGGTLQHLGLEGKADVVMGSFDKALGGMGGFLAGRKDLIRFLRISARAYIFSSALPAVMANAMIGALQVARGGELLRRRLRQNHDVLRAGLSSLGFQLLGDGVVPVVPVIVGKEGTAVQFQRRLFDEGILATAFRWPAVPRGAARIRVTPMAGHTEAHLRRAIDAFGRVGRELQLIP
jgi:glycine C-acetyltransferase